MRMLEVKRPDGTVRYNVIVDRNGVEVPDPDLASSISVGTSIASPGAITFSKDQAADLLGPTVISSSWGGGGNGGNPYVYLGYNIDGPGWNFINDNDQAAFWGVEGNYDDISANNKMEMYGQWQFAEGKVGVTYARSFMAQFDKVTKLPTFTQVNAGILFGVDLNYTDGTGTDSQKITGKQAFNAGQNGVNTAFLPTTFNDTTSFLGLARFNDAQLTGSLPTYPGHVTIESGQTDAASNGLEFMSATTGAGYGFRVATVYDGGSNIDFQLQRRANSAAWTNAFRVKGGTGAIANVAGTAGAPSYGFQSDATKGFYDPGSNAIDVTIAGAAQVRFGNGSVTLFSNGGNNFVSLASDGVSDVMALKRADNPNTLRVYGAVTGTKYASLAHDGTNPIIGSSSGGLKANATAIAPASSGTRYLVIDTNGLITSSASAPSGT